jgi:hypothetical protein
MLGPRLNWMISLSRLRTPDAKGAKTSTTTTCNKLKTIARIMGYLMTLVGVLQTEESSAQAVWAVYPAARVGRFHCQLLPITGSHRLAIEKAEPRAGPETP